MGKDLGCQEQLAHNAVGVHRESAISFMLAAASRRLQALSCHLHGGPSATAALVRSLHVSAISTVNGTGPHPLDSPQLKAHQDRVPKLPLPALAEVLLPYPAAVAHVHSFVALV